MTYELEREVKDIPSPFLVVCDGYSDVRLIDKLLQHHHISNCRVGCKSDKFAPNLRSYLAAIKGVANLQSRLIRGVLVVMDADKSPKSAFVTACEALEYAEFPVPSKPFVIEELNPRVAIYIVPGIKRKGTVEHLLLEAAYKKNPRAEKCTDEFFRCIGNARSTANAKAKMRMSALVAATCTGNPWASAAMMWSDKPNPVPINSSCFKHLVGFPKQFSI
ncbi:MAG: DUF3226 domain-containing protein [Candidatus Micrarchaeaceae archaeon]|jgi:hypothetical protein